MVKDPHLLMNQAPFAIKGRRVLLLAEGCFSPLESKTAVCFLRYSPEEVVGVFDSSKAPAKVRDVLGFGGDVPLVGSVDEALACEPDVVLVGVAPRGGGLDEEFRSLIMSFIERGIDIVSGLHVFLRDDEEIRSLAGDRGARIWDVRAVPEIDEIGTGRGCTSGAKTVLVMGSDCNVGKMTCTLELYISALEKGLRANWAATGQTGIMLKGRGIAIDRVISDFVGGAAEALVNVEGGNCEILFVEGQGSLIHPAYAGVALGLMFGVMPDAMIVAHEAGRTRVRGYEVDIPAVRKLIELHEIVMAPVKKVPVCGIALNTSNLSEPEALKAMEAMSGESGLAVCDPVRFGASKLVEAAVNALG